MAVGDHPARLDGGKREEAGRAAPPPHRTRQPPRAAAPPAAPPPPHLRGRRGGGLWAAVPAAGAAAGGAVRRAAGGRRPQLRPAAPGAGPVADRRALEAQRALHPRAGAGRGRQARKARQLLRRAGARAGEEAGGVQRVRGLAAAADLAQRGQPQQRQLRRRVARRSAPTPYHSAPVAAVSPDCSDCSCRSELRGGALHGDDAPLPRRPRARRRHQLRLHRQRPGHPPAGRARAIGGAGGGAFAAAVLHRGGAGRPDDDQRPAACQAPAAHPTYAPPPSSPDHRSQLPPS